MAKPTRAQRKASAAKGRATRAANAAAAAAAAAAASGAGDKPLRKFFKRILAKRKEAQRISNREAYLDSIRLPCFHMGVGKGVYKFCDKKPGEKCTVSKSKYFPRRGRCVTK